MGAGRHRLERVALRVVAIGDPVEGRTAQRHQDEVERVEPSPGRRGTTWHGGTVGACHRSGEPGRARAPQGEVGKRQLSATELRGGAAPEYGRRQCRRRPDGHGQRQGRAEGVPARCPGSSTLQGRLGGVAPEECELIRRE